MLMWVRWLELEYHAVIFARDESDGPSNSDIAPITTSTVEAIPPRLDHARERAATDPPRRKGPHPAGFGCSALERQVVVTRPLVPRACVVARLVARCAQRERRQCGTRAGVAVRDDLLRFADERSQFVRADRRARAGEEILDVHVTRSRDVSLARIARIAGFAGELLGRPHVEDRERLVLE